LQAVTMMDRVIAEVEKDPLYRTLMQAQYAAPERNRPDAICAALRDVTGISGQRHGDLYQLGHTSLRAA
jgi:pyruvate kinase